MKKFPFGKLVLSALVPLFGYMLLASAQEAFDKKPAEQQTKKNDAKDDIRRTSGSLSKIPIPGAVVRLAESTTTVGGSISVRELEQAIIEAILHETKQAKLPALLKEDPGTTTTIPTDIVQDTIHTQIKEVIRMVQQPDESTIRVEFRPGIEWVDFPPHFRPVIVRHNVPCFAKGKIIEVVDKVEETIHKAVRVLHEVDVKTSYSVFLQEVKLAMTDDTLTLEAKLGFTMKGEIVRAGIIPAGPMAVTEGRLNASIIRKVKWDDKGNLNLENGSSNLFIDPTTAVTSFPLHSMGLILKIDALLAALAGPLDQIIAKEIPGNILSAQQLADVVPRRVGVPKLATFVPNVQELLLYPASSDGETIRLVVGVRARPELRFGKEAEILPATTPKLTSMQGMAPKPMFIFRFGMTVDDSGKISMAPISPRAADAGKVR